MAELKCKDGTVVKISDETEQELRKAFGKKLKHGDYGFYNGHRSDPCVVCKNGEDFKVVNDHHWCNYPLDQYVIEGFEVIGNFIEDLKGK